MKKIFRLLLILIYFQPRLNGESKPNITSSTEFHRDKRDTKQTTLAKPASASDAMTETDNMTDSVLDRLLFKHECGEATMTELIVCISIIFIFSLLTTLLTIVIAKTSTSDISEKLQKTNEPKK